MIWSEGTCSCITLRNIPKACSCPHSITFIVYFFWRNKPALVHLYCCFTTLTAVTLTNIFVHICLDHGPWYIPLSINSVHVCSGYESWNHLSTCYSRCSYCICKKRLFPFLPMLVSYMSHGTISNRQIVWWSSLRLAPITARCPWLCSKRKPYRE